MIHHRRGGAPLARKVAPQPATVSGFSVGDVITLPPEPPVGTRGDGRTNTGDTVKLRRRVDGWQLGRSGHRFPWRVVAQLWLPLTITGFAREDKSA